MTTLKANIVNSIGKLLTSICRENSISKISNNNLINPFLTGRNKNISIKSYLTHLVKYTQIELPTIIAMLIYIDRLCRENNFRLNYFNIYKIILSSLVLAVKFNEDNFFDNHFYAKVGGLTTKELNEIEYHFLTLINFSLVIDDNVYLRYYSNLLSVIEMDV